MSTPSDGPPATSSSAKPWKQSSGAAAIQFRKVAQDNLKNIKENQERFQAEKVRSHRRTPITSDDSAPIAAASGIGASSFLGPGTAGSHGSRPPRKPSTATAATLAERRPSASSARSASSADGDSDKPHTSRAFTAASTVNGTGTFQKRERTMSDPGSAAPEGTAFSPDAPPGGRVRGKRIITAPVASTFPASPKEQQIADIASPPEGRKVNVFRSKRADPSSLKEQQIHYAASAPDGRKASASRSRETGTPLRAEAIDRGHEDSDDDATGGDDGGGGSVVIRSDEEDEAEPEETASPRSRAQMKDSNSKAYSGDFPRGAEMFSYHRAKLSTVDEVSSEDEDIAAKAARARGQLSFRHHARGSNRIPQEDLASSAESVHSYEEHALSESPPARGHTRDNTKSSGSSKRSGEPISRSSSRSNLTNSTRTADHDAHRVYQATPSELALLDHHELLPAHKKIHDLLAAQAEETATLQRRIDELNATINSKTAHIEASVRSLKESLPSWKEEMHAWVDEADEMFSRRRDEEVRQHEMRLRTAILRKADKKGDEIRSKLNNLSAKLRDLENDSLRELAARIGSSLLAYAWNGLLLVIGSLVVLFGPIIGALLRLLGPLARNISNAMGPRQARKPATPTSRLTPLASEDYYDDQDFENGETSLPRAHSWSQQQAHGAAPAESRPQEPEELSTLSVAQAMRAQAAGRYVRKRREGRQT